MDGKAAAMAAPEKADGVGRLGAVVERQRRELHAIRARAAEQSVVDLAAGMLMERLGCTVDEARSQLAGLAEQAGTTLAGLAAQVAGQLAPHAVPGTGYAAAAGLAAGLAADGDEVATALLDEGLAPTGAAAVVIWLAEPDGSLWLAGQAGLDAHAAGHWRHIPPQMDAPCQRTVRSGREILWPEGRPEGEAVPLIGDWPGGARAVLPMLDAGIAAGVMEVCWPEPLPGFPPGLRRQLDGLADLAARTLAGPGLADTARGSHGPRAVLDLLDWLAESVLVASAVRDAGGAVTDLRIEHLSPAFADPGGRSPGELAGRSLLEAYPAAAVAGSLFDRAVEVLETGHPQRLAGEVLGTPPNGPGPVLDLRVARLFDAVVVIWRQLGEAERLAALLEHAQRIGHIGAWEEDLVAGRTIWTARTAALFGEPEGAAVPLAEMDVRVEADDLQVLRSFRNALLTERRPAAALLRVRRADNGSMRQLRAFAEPVADAGGRVTGLRGAYQDVSAEYHAQLAFAAARDQLAEAEQRADEEHRLALRLQEAITPRSPSPPGAAGIEVAARYRPAAARSVVGGDWYETATLGDGELLLAVGDVAGHGLDAVNGMVMLRNGLRGLAVTGQGPATMLSWLNQMACQFADGLIATAVCGRYEPASRTLRWARAGHLPPVLVRYGEAAELPVPPGLMLGADPRAEYGEVKTELRPGDLLLLYTDGLIERRDRPIDESLAEFLRLAQEPAPSIGRYADYLLRRSPSDSGDDTCLVVVRVR
jgi:serine phosphatase RsbU (regulator of sigma subunit)